jgi:uncharacterized membrane protein YedE/YeeE
MSSQNAFVKYFVYLFSGIIFALGLSLSGMIDPLKVKAFLSVGFSDWNPALLFVLGSAVPVYLLAFLFLRQRKKTWSGTRFTQPRPRPIDSKLLAGSVIFGLGWGIAGICPGPALVHIGFIDMSFAGFIGAMFVGFEVHRRMSV